MNYEKAYTLLFNAITQAVEQLSQDPLPQDEPYITRGYLKTALVLGKTMYEDQAEET